MIPSVADCFRYMEQYRMLDNIRSHSVIVARVGHLLVQKIWLRDGEGPALDRVVAGALMHDIAKTSCLDTEEDHARKGKEICLAHGFDEIAEIVAHHVILQEYSDTGLSEEELVYYADKRVNHDKVVSLETRLEYILERYAGNDQQRKESILRNFKLCQELETKIFSRLDFTPDELKDHVDHRLFTV